MDFIVEWRNSRANILVILLLDKIASRFFKSRSLATGRLLATIVLFLVFESLELGILALAQRPLAPILWPSLVMACLGSLFFYSITWAHQFALDYMERIIRPGTLGKNAEGDLIGWIRTWANLRYQYIASVITIAIVLSYGYWNRVFLDIRDLVVFISLLSWGAGQGFYWGLATPFLTVKIGQHLDEVETDPIYPSRSPLLKMLSQQLLVFAVWIAGLITLFIVFAFLMAPQMRTGSSLYVVIATLISYAVSGWTFIFSQYNLSRIVRRIKEDTLRQIQTEINKTFQSLSKLEKSDFERLEKLMELHKTISERANTLIDVSTLRTFIASLLTPTFATLVGIVDWSGLLQKIVSFIPLRP